MASAIPQAIERLLATPTISARFPCRNPMDNSLPINRNYLKDGRLTAELPFSKKEDSASLVIKLQSSGSAVLNDPLTIKGQRAVDPHCFDAAAETTAFKRRPATTRKLAV